MRSYRLAVRCRRLVLKHRVNRPTISKALQHRDEARTQPLVASEALHRDAAEVASDWIWEIDADLRLTFVSKRFGDTSGIAWEKVTGRAIGDLVDLGFDRKMMAHLRATIETRNTFQRVVCRVAVAVDQLRFWRLSGKPFFDQETGTFAGYRGSGTDVTAAIEREATLKAAVRRAEAAEQEATEMRARLMDAINTIPEGFVLHDAADRLVLSNTRYGEIYGLSANLLLPGATFEDAVRASAANGVYVFGDGQRLEGWVADRLQRHRAIEGTNSVQRLANGRWVQEEERRTSEGGTVGILIDVTEARHLEAMERDRDRRVAELRAARSMQISLLPSPHLLKELTSSCCLDIASRSESCSELGGDLWGISALEQGQVGFFIVDFAGHGTAAALNTFRLHALIHELRSVQNDPARFLSDLNIRLTELLPPGAFATMFYGVIDPANDRMSYAAAGSPPPVIRGAKDRRPIAIDSAGVPLGISAAAKYACSTIEFGSGAALCLYSDMLTECMDATGVRSGEAGAFKLIEIGISHPTAEAMVERICAPFLQASAPALTDDLTVVCITRR